MILDILEVEVRQAGFGYRRVGSVKEVGMCAKILLEGEMDQPNSRGILIHGDNSLAAAE